MILGQLSIYMQKMKLDPNSHILQKLTQKWIKYLNVRAKIIKFLEENLGMSVWDFEFILGTLNLKFFSFLCNERKIDN